MSDKRKVKEIINKISKQKKRVASNFGKIVEKNEHLFSILIPIFAGLIFLCLSVLNLTSSIWFDESYSAYLVRGDFGQIWNMTAVDVHPPFFYFALKMWSSLFGTSDVAMRFMSVFFGLIALVFIFHLVKKLFGIRVAGVSTIFAAISPMFIRYAQEMRMYTMVLAIVFAASYFLLQALENAKDKKGIKYFVVYAILIAMGMWTHYFSAFAWLAHVAIIVVHFGGFKKIFKDKVVLKRLILTYAFAVLLYIPWIPSFFSQVKSVQAGFWIPPLSFEVMADFITSVLFFNKAQEVTSWGWLFGVLLIAVFIIALRKVYLKQSGKNKGRIRFLAILASVPVLIMTILSLPPLTSTFVDRYVLYSIVALWILFGVVLMLLKDGLLKSSLLALVVIVSVFGAGFVTHREPRGYVSEILAETFIAAEEKEPIVTSSPFIYYDGVFYTSEEHPIQLFEEDIEYKWGSLEPIRNYRVNVIENREEFLKEHKKFWYLYDTPAKGEKFKVPEWAEKMRIVSEISLDHNTAIEFVQD